MLTARQLSWIVVAASAAVGLVACGHANLSPQVEAQVSSIKLTKEAPPGCRYVGEAVSFHRSFEGKAIVPDAELGYRAHDNEVKLHALKIGANTVHTVYERNNDMTAIVRVTAFYACGGRA